MAATTVSWLDKIEKASIEELRKTKEGLKERMIALSKEKRVLDEQVNRLKLDICFIEANLAAINKRLSNESFLDVSFNKEKLFITDHAALRYVERMLGFHIDGIKEDIINAFPDKIPIDSTCVKTGKTMYHVRKNRDAYVIVTIIKKG